MPPESILVQFLSGTIEAERVADSPACELLLRQARSANLLSRVAALCDDKNLTSRLPQRMQNHLQSAQAVAEANHRSVKWEAKQIELTLLADDIPFCLLKGGAYVVGQTVAAKGRVFSDVDILVPREFLEKTEQLLIRKGWMCTNFDSYDQRYYRTWMHELPPLQHMKRGTTLDVHHAIIPPTARIKSDIEKIWKSAHKVDKYKVLYIPDNKDLVLHSAVHLFCDGELENGLRDLSDLDLLLRDLSVNDDFWAGLLARSVELNLQRPLFYALRYTHALLKTPVPAKFLTASKQGSPGSLVEKWMDFLFYRALLPDHITCTDRWTGLARWMLFVRSHWLKMPPLQLAQHLARKGYKRWKKRNASV
ncbi:hypothetical protein A9Q88_09445 [Gammaproteobacteria bacterium 50_400_T64]|nr:hypothetical protein A9Q88_09445 [Gammaproteobacteria bacterium 50_400_T64]